MDEARSQTSEAYEMVTHEDAASPSSQAAVARADDVYRAFFQDDDDDDEAQEEDEDEGTRRHAFFDEILAACVAEREERARLYPSKANRRLLLSTIYGSAALDRIQSDALVLYLVMRRGLAPARRFARAARLPSHVFSLIRAYWHLDGGRYLVRLSLLPSSSSSRPTQLTQSIDQAAVPLLPRELDPAQAEKILAVLNPLDGAPSPEEEAERALAMDRFLALCVPSSSSSSSSSSPLLLLDEQLAPARIVSLCHARGIVEAWNTVLRNDTLQQTPATRAACIVALVRFCLVPVARRAAVDALVAMCLSPREDAELADALLLAAAPALSKAGEDQQATLLPEAARATALDLVVVRRITAGRYVDALRLLARMAAAAGSTVVTDSKLRHKRQALVAAAKAALTHVERSLLAIEGAAAAHTQGADDEDMGARDGGEGDVHMAMSWEAVHQDSEHSPAQPLTASPAVRASPLRQGGRGAAEAQSALLAAVLRASPRSQSRSQSQSQSQSPTPPRPVRTNATTAKVSASASASASPLRAKSRLAFRASLSSSPSSSSPAAAVASSALRVGQRPYSLDDKSAFTGNNGGVVTAPEHSAFTDNNNDGAYTADNTSQQAAAAEAQAEIDGEAGTAAAETGPYARLARQLQAHYSAAAGSSSSGPPSPSDVLQPLLRRRGAREGSSHSLAAMDVDGGADSSRQGEEPARDKASLMQRPARRYEATYRIDSSGRRRQAEKHGDDENEHAQGNEHEEHEQETPAKARHTRRTRAAAARKGAGTKKEQQTGREQAEEEEGQDQLMELAESPRKPATKRRGSPTKKKTTKSAATKEPAAAAPRRSTRLSSAEPAARTPLTASATLPEMRELGSATATATATGTRAKARATRTRSASPAKRAQEQGAEDDDEGEEEEEVPRRRTRTRSSRMDMPGAF